MVPCGMPYGDNTFTVTAKLLILTIELFNHLIRDVQGLLMIQHNFDRTPATFVHHECEPVLLGNRLRRAGNFLHIFINELFLFRCQLAVELLYAPLIALHLGTKLCLPVPLLDITEPGIVSA